MRCRRMGEKGELSEHGNQLMNDLHLQAYAKGKMKLIFVEILRELKASGYKVSARLMNAMYFGVPQSRERMIFIGVREDLWDCIRAR
jgi:site-specific DNA-cytosine methylase